MKNTIEYGFYQKIMKGRTYEFYIKTLTTQTKFRTKYIKFCADTVSSIFFYFGTKGDLPGGVV